MALKSFLVVPRRGCTKVILAKMERLVKVVYLWGILLDFSAVFSYAQQAPGGERCNLSDGQYGKCLPMRNCIQVRQLSQGGSITANCGFEGTKGLVCCPMPALQVQEPPQFTGKFILSEVKSTVPGETAKRWCNYYKTACRAKIPKRELNPFGNKRLVVGGDPASKTEFPHMAAIGYGNQSNIQWGCGGSLISESFVLTAAHCLSDGSRKPASWIRLGALIIQDDVRGSSSGADEGQTHPVIERIRHPGYKKPSKYNDLALLKIGPALEANALPTFSWAIHPACLQVEEKAISSAIAIGWGRVGQGDDVTSGLQKVNLSMLENSECNRTFEIEIKTTQLLLRGIDESQTCAGVLEGGKDTCTGDSGGPLQTTDHEGSCLHQIIAATSFGKICGLKNSPAVYSRVTFFLDWIEEHVWKERELCSLDDGQYGECLLISNCTNVHPLISQGYKPVNCGFEGKEPKVCCPPPTDWF